MNGSIVKVIKESRIKIEEFFKVIMNENIRKIRQKPFDFIIKL